MDCIVRINENLGIIFFEHQYRNINFDNITKFREDSKIAIFIVYHSNMVFLFLKKYININ